LIKSIFDFLVDACYNKLQEIKLEEIKMPDFLLLWLALTLLNLLIFIRIDWGLLKSKWDEQVWAATIICCLIPPIGWGALAALWYQYRQGNK
jgi:hypothetical protein